MTFEEFKKFHDYLIERGLDGNFTLYTSTSFDWYIKIPNIDYDVFYFDKDHKFEEIFEDFEDFVDKYSLL